MEFKDLMLGIIILIMASVLTIAFGSNDHLQMPVWLFFGYAFFVFFMIVILPLTNS